jgi:hypothetical protein
VLLCHKSCLGQNRAQVERRGEKSFKREKVLSSTMQIILYNRCCDAMHNSLGYNRGVCVDNSQNIPCTNREHSSGRYLIKTFLLLYRRNPNSGDVSSYWAIAFRISTIPPFPRPSTSTSSRLAYFRRNLFQGEKKISIRLAALQWPEDRKGSREDKNWGGIKS